MVNATRRFALAIVGTAASFFGVSGCSDDPPPAPQALVHAFVKAPAGGTKECTVGGAGREWVNVDPVTKDGDKQLGAEIGVTCKVSGNDTDGYDIAAVALQTGKGSLTIAGTKVLPGPGPHKVTATFQSPDFGPFSSSECVAEFSQGNMGIAPGRVWATFTCATVRDDQHNSTCAAEGEFRFENCDK
jgi:hypothetical protein